MVIKQVTILLLFTLINAAIFSLVDCQAIFPTTAQQVNLLDNVHDLFQQIKNASTSEQNALDESFSSDMESAFNMAVFYKNALLELMISKLRSNTNAVCSFNALDQMVMIGNQASVQLEECKAVGIESLGSMSGKVSADMEFAVNAGESFLQKLNSCSTKKGLAVIGCYNKIIQIDVIPVKTVLSEAIENHRRSHIALFGLQKSFNQCIEATMHECKRKLEESFNEGLSCN